MSGRMKCQFTDCGKRLYGKKAAVHQIWDKPIALGFTRIKFGCRVCEREWVQIRYPEKPNKLPNKSDIIIDPKSVCSLREGDLFTFSDIDGFEDNNLIFQRKDFKCGPNIYHAVEIQYGYPYYDRSGMAN